MKTIPDGLVVAFDGPDGVGKSTQIKLLGEWLSSQGIVVHTTRHSGGTPIGEALRLVSLSDTPRPAATDLYISLAMATALAEDLKSHRHKGEITLLDRSPLAILAYNVYGSQLPDQSIGRQAMMDTFAWLKLDTLVFLNAKPATLEKRLNSRTDKPLDFYEKQGPEYLDRVQVGYQTGLKLAREIRNPRIEIHEVDANGSIEEVQAQVRKLFDRVL